MISNPISLFVDGNTRRRFVHEGGPNLWHFSPKANGLSSIMDCNIVFFAGDRLHALDVLKQMFEFVIECSEVYAKQRRNSRQYSAESLRANAIKKIAKYQSWLEALEQGKIMIVIAPTDQFYKVGWADNDTI